MAGLAGQALTTGGFAAAFSAFVTTAAVLVGLLFSAALTVAVTQERLTERIRATTPAIKHWGGWILIAVGTWFVVLGVFAAAFARVFRV
jgi:hypothetical protein